MTKIASLSKFLAIQIFFAANAYAQVGINTSMPRATLDLVAKKATGTSTGVDGLLIPRVDRQRAQSMADVPSSTLIYVNDTTTGSRNGNAVHIDSAGYYYYNGTVWNKLYINLYNSDGTITENRTVNMLANSLAWNSTATTTNVMEMNAGSLTSGKVLDIKTGTLSTGSAIHVTSANSANNPNGILKISNTSPSAAGTFATLQANNTPGSGVNILNNGNVGLGINAPNSSLAVEGSFEAAYKETTASTTLTDKDHYITFSGTSPNQIITLPNIGSGGNSFSGRIYKIKNASAQKLTLVSGSGSTLRPGSYLVPTFDIPPGAYVEVVNNNNTGNTAVWDLSFIAQSSLTNVEIYGGQAIIPPHNQYKQDFSNHSNTEFDTPEWWVISKTSFSASSSGSGTNIKLENAKMVIVYEYQGTPFSVTGLYPILTAGNNTSYPDVYTSNFISIANNGTAGKTRITVSIARNEISGVGTNWGGTFLLNILLAKRIGN